jgi:tetraspanin-4
VPVLGWGEGGDTHCSLVDPLFPQIDRYAQQDLKKGLHLYGTEGNVGLTNAWSIIQTDVRIWCGWGRGQAAEAAGEGGPLSISSLALFSVQFRCCGVSNYTDWFEVYNTTRVPDSCCLEFSDSCGLHAPGTWWKAVSVNLTS